jgi:MFS family permease
MKPTSRLTVVAVLLFMARGMTGPLSSLYWRSLGASYVTIGLLGASTAVTAIAASALWGRASDRLGRRSPFLLGGLATLGLGFAAISAVPGYRWLFPLYVVTALGQAAYDTASLALMGDWLEQGATADARGAHATGRRMGGYRGLASLGFGVMALVAGTVADRLGLRVPYGLAAGLYGLALVVATGVPEPTQDDGTDPAPLTSQAPLDETGSDSEALPVGRAASGMGDQRKAPRLPLLPLLISAVLWSLVTGGVYAVWGNYMVDELGYSPAQMTRLWALASLSEFPLMWLAGWLSDRVGRLTMLTVGFLAWTAVFTGYLAVPTMPWIIVVQLVRGFAYSAHTATAMTYAAEVRSRSERGKVSGLYGTAGALGSILGSSVGGVLTEALGFRALIGLAAGIIFAGAIYLASAALRLGTRARDATPVPTV